MGVTRRDGAGHTRQVPGHKHPLTFPNYEQHCVTAIDFLLRGTVRRLLLVVPCCYLDTHTHTGRQRLDNLRLSYSVNNHLSLYLGNFNAQEVLTQTDPNVQIPSPLTSVSLLHLET